MKKSIRVVERAQPGDVCPRNVVTGLSAVLSPLPAACCLKAGRGVGADNDSLAAGRSLPMIEMQHSVDCILLRATAGTAIARRSHRNSVCPSVCPSVCHTGGSGKNGAS